jgi:hypothetical protein
MQMRSIGFGVAFALGTYAPGVLATSAPGEQRATGINEAAPFARPERFVLPALGAGLRKELAGQQFVLSFDVGAAGSPLGLPVIEPPHPALAEALSKVLRYWRFSPKADLAACSPVADRVQAQISIPAGEGDVRIEMALPAPPADAAARAARLKGWVPVRKPAYPQIALLDGVSARVWVSARVDAQGATQPVSSALASDATRDRDYGFVRVASENVAAYRFPPQPDAPPICVLVPFDFRINR